jgi:tetratricopeptide (TPR) repeat protein
VTSISWVGVLLAVPLVPGAVTGAQASFFDEANRLYQQGEYSEALEDYLHIVDSGLESGVLYFNIGNTYFKLGDLGHSILYYERAQRLLPRDADVRANLELARSLTADEITPLPRFWLFRVVGWWVHLMSTSLLTLIVAVAYLVAMGGVVVTFLRRGSALADWGRWLAFGGAAIVVIFGINLVVLELGIGRPEEAVVMVDEVGVNSAPSDDEALLVFAIHEGTKVRIDRRADEWLEVVLEDGKVGWVRADVVEVI